MAMRPLDELPTIRAKLGSVIVLAVAVTIVVSFVAIAFVLKATPKDSEAIRALALARRAADGELVPLPRQTMVVIRSYDGTVTVTGVRFDVSPPEFNDGMPHWGVIGRITYASIPTSDGRWVTVLQPSPSRGFLGRISSTLGFLQSVWWQFAIVGLVAAVVALVLARWVARGMTQPLRDMAAAAKRMETGDYGTRVYTPSRDEVGQLAVAFNAMSAEMETLEQSRRELVANVSHELKTPIAAIRAHLENLADGVEQPDPETLAVMLAQTERLGRLVDQLLDLSKLQSGEVPLARDVVVVAPLVGRVFSEISVGRAVADVRLESDVSPDVAVDADEERLHQVLFNLVDNAVRFTPPGGQVRVSVERREEWVEFRVRDTGVGIAPEHLPRLFERFYRVDPARARDDGSGTGIGLAIARSVVEAHGGRIHAESSPGHGSTFFFEIPAADVAMTSPDRRKH
jgi:signal transduction histidine kinase